MKNGSYDFDVIVIGGGPAGSVIASMLAMAGRSCLVLERDIHPRDHVGESLTPSSNLIWDKIGFAQKIEDAGFVKKGGACWTAPRSPEGRFVAIRLGEFPIPGSDLLYTYNVERDALDAMLLRHAHELGAKVLQGVAVQRVLFEAGRAVGVTAKMADGWSRDLRARLIVDASGRRAVLANQLGFKRKDPHFNQFGLYSWFRGMQPLPSGYEGYLFLHFLGLNQAWAWQIPLRNGIHSIGIVTNKDDFKRSRQTEEEWFRSLVGRSRSLTHNMQEAEQIRPWWLEGDYSYKIDRLSGDGWLLIGDALRFIDPIFSTGVDVATYSAMHAFNAIESVLAGGVETEEFKRYERLVTDGVDAWYDLISLFYKLQNLFTLFAVRRAFREKVVRILQGNLYQPESLARAREMISLMQETHERVMQQPANLLRPGAFNSVLSDGDGSAEDGLESLARAAGA